MTTFNHPTKQLGKCAPRLDTRNFKLSKYIQKLAVPPIRAGYLGRVKSWPMYLNDSLGDCVIAAAGHMIQEWTAYAGKEVTISNDAILKGYEDVGGYVPGDSSTDNGCDMLTALRYWRSKGFGGHKIAAFIAVDPGNQTEVEQAIDLFGNVYAGFALPLSAQDQNSCWSVPTTGTTGDGSPGSWGGHCVPLLGYSNDPAGQPGVMVITWGAPMAVTWKFVRNYCDEMFAIVTQDWLNAAGKSPTGFDLAQLTSDLASV